MNTTQKNSFIRILMYVLIALFFLLLWAPFFQMIFRTAPEVALDENRRFAPMPELKTLSFRKTIFQKSFEQYYMDHFGFRGALISANNYLIVTTFGVSPHPNVGIGKNGWLFYDYPHDGMLFKDYAGLLRFDRSRLAKIAANMDAVHSMLALSGIAFMVIVAPDKQTIYPEYMSDSVPKPATKTRLDQMLEYMLEQKPHIIIVDSRESLLRAKKQFMQDLYYRTDTHWNALGAFVSGNALLTKLSERFADMKAPAITDHDISHETKIGGDLAKMLSMDNRILDDQWHLTQKKPVALSSFDPGYHEEIPRGTIGYTQNKATLPRLLMYHDSFGDSLKPFLAAHFSRSVFLWTHVMDKKHISQEKPDIVVLEIVERDLENLSDEGKILRR